MGDAPTFERWWPTVAERWERIQLPRVDVALGAWIASRAALKAEVLAELREMLADENDLMSCEEWRQMACSESLWLTKGMKAAVERAIARIEKL